MRTVTENAEKLRENLVSADPLEAPIKTGHYGTKTWVVLDDDDDDDVLAAYGYIFLWPGVIHVWSKWSRKGIDEHNFSICKQIKRELMKAERDFKPDRVQIIIRAENKGAVGLAELLDFEEEGVMRNYMNGVDFLIMSRVNN